MRMYDLKWPGDRDKLLHFTNVTVYWNFRYLFDDRNPDTFIESEIDEGIEKPVYYVWPIWYVNSGLLFIELFLGEISGSRGEYEYEMLRLVV